LSRVKGREAADIIGEVVVAIVIGGIPGQLKVLFGVHEMAFAGGVADAGIGIQLDIGFAGILAFFCRDQDDPVGGAGPVDGGGGSVF
jgi:hypothetical protein